MPQQNETNEDGPNEALDDAMTEGVAAFMRGEGLDGNPYPHSWTDLHEAWRKGWLNYQKFYHR
jgi:hypothetical protein